MTTRNDVTVDFDRSPRIAEISSPSTDMTMQDLVDTIRKIEDRLAIGMSETKLLNASGKEDLGGGVLVGITVALQNAQVAFEGRTTPAESGTVTTASSTPINNTITFSDSAADFVTAGIAPGSLVINYTDRSIADVVEVVDSTTLKTKTLVNGIGNTYDVADIYDVFNIIQCDLEGGNLVSVDESDIAISPVLPTAFTQIVRTSSSSATISEQTDIQYASFNGGVTVDTTNGTSGTTFPTGTPRQPVNNFSDALTIASTRGFSTLYIIGDATIDSGLDFSSLTIVGESKNKSLFTISSSANVTNSEFTDATVQGTLDGGNVLFGCSLLTLNFVDGFIEQCVINDVITLSGANDATLLDCFSGVPGPTTPTINMGGSGSSLSLRNYNGGITLTNKTGASDDVSIDINSGQVILDNSVDAGIILLRGVGTWTNKSTYTGNASVTDQLVTVADVQQASFNNRVFVDPVNGSSGTAYPLGTSGNPVDNITDAISIATARGLTTLFINGNVSIGTETDWTRWKIIGHSVLNSSITVSASSVTDNLDFSDIKLLGVINGNGIVATRCVLTSGLQITDGIFRNCGIGNAVEFIGSSSNIIHLHSCFETVRNNPSGSSIDMGGDSSQLIIHNYSGELSIFNKTGSAHTDVGINGGTITLESTITNGTIHLFGVGVLTDNSVGATIIDNITRDTPTAIQNLLSTTIDTQTFEDIQKFLLAMATGRITKSGDSYTFYEQDNTTAAFTLTKSTTERTRS